MSPPSLGSMVRGLIASHPNVSVSVFGHAEHAERFITKKGAPLGFEPRRVRFQNLWVRADSVDLNRLSDIEQKYFDHTTFKESKPNHDLYGEHAFKDADLIRFKITTSWQAARVIAEVAGDGSES